MKITEENFIKQLKHKNEKAMEYVITTYGWLVKSIVSAKLKLLPNDQEDCMNEIFWAVWLHVECYQKEKGSFENWIAGVAKYKCIDYYRKHGKNNLDENIDNVSIAARETAEDSMQQIWMEEEFEKLISCLSEVDKEVFRKCFWEEKEIEVVSHETGIKKANLYNHLSKGKKKIRKMFG